MIMRSFNFYAEDQEGINGTDYRVEICELEDGTIEASESRCGRSRGCFWTEPEVVFEGSHFWLTVQRLIRDYGGMKAISDTRIGQVDRW